jgi:hypothetical protein
MRELQVHDLCELCARRPKEISRENQLIVCSSHNFFGKMSRLKQANTISPRPVHDCCYVQSTKRQNDIKTKITLLQSIERVGCIDVIPKSGVHLPSCHMYCYRCMPYPILRAGLPDAIDLKRRPCNTQPKVWWSFSPTSCPLFRLPSLCVSIRIRIHHRSKQLLHDLAARLVANVVNLLDLDIRILLRIVLGLLVA